MSVVLKDKTALVLPAVSSAAKVIFLDQKASVAFPWRPGPRLAPAPPLLRCSTTVPPRLTGPALPGTDSSHFITLGPFPCSGRPARLWGPSPVPQALGSSSLGSPSLPCLLGQLLNTSFKKTWFKCHLFQKAFPKVPLSHT